MVTAILTVAIMGSLAGMSTVVQQNRVSVETSIATQAIRAELESMRSHDFATLWDAYQSGGSHGGFFKVHGLNPPASGSPHGSITFVGEQDVAAQWGSAVDLNMDDSTSSPAPKDRSIEVVTLVYDRTPQ
ncbi:MAG: hypothetical protein ACYTG4_10460 [Planctomycetota bacterium]|jgi:hypothetical protein